MRQNKENNKSYNQSSQEKQQKKNRGSQQVGGKESTIGGAGNTNGRPVGT